MSEEPEPSAELFNTVLNYQPLTDALTSERDGTLTPRKTALVAEKNSLESASAYASDPTIVARLAELTNSIATIDARVADINDVLAEITAIGNLSDPEKTLLYYFYTVVESTKAEFMARMLFNHQAALANPAIIQLTTDIVTPRETKIALAKVFYNSYGISIRYTQVIVMIFRVAL